MKENSLITPAGNGRTSRRAWQARLLTFCLLPSAFCLSGCNPPPETAAELQGKLPAQYQGELHLRGETESHRIVLETHDFKERGAHLLEFGKVRYQFFTGNTLTADGEADIRGTISAPGLVVTVEGIGGEGVGDMLKPGSFQGQLSRDLRQLVAHWDTGFGQNVSLRAQASAPR